VDAEPDDLDDMTGTTMRATTANPVGKRDGKRTREHAATNANAQSDNSASNAHSTYLGAGIPSRPCATAGSLTARNTRSSSALPLSGNREAGVPAVASCPRTGHADSPGILSIVGELTLDTLWHAVPSFPTLSEVWLRLLETYRDEHEVEFI
jgi:hypothetical protein